MATAHAEKGEVRLERAAGGAMALAIAGTFAPGWSGNLAVGLARIGISIERGVAENVGGGSWRAHFELARAGFRGDPREIDVLALARRDAGAGFGTPVPLTAFRLDAVAERSGSLYLEIEGRDGVGFLAALLRRLAFFALFPVELRLDTRDGLVSDRFWLKAAGGRRPTARTREALARNLELLRVA